MFGITFGKLFIIAVIIVVVWFGYRYLQRVEKLSEIVLNRRPQARERDPDKVVAEEMVKCRVCGSYASAKAASCGRKDCPFGG